MKSALIEMGGFEPYRKKGQIGCKKSRKNSLKMLLNFLQHGEKIVNLA